ncbi:fibulin-2 isoform X2 [Microcaecilia unicolor]|uniref:Fibulin-2 isoform X2 n=1 Tax=Microcaecilia unicolor TaxID=1415580 RepID=A0A6P7YGI4_9AMPH|nr:fibulin-2 isoform X2 [Microcaecilia unicolor]
MNMFNIKHLNFLNCLLVLVWAGISGAQKDCTGVECEPLQNCIEEVLESGACCASCLQFGCTCEGYQYYDCVNMGYRNGKVPEQESYFVDFGSTECLCPKGGGNISCQFIPCPELSPNCIDVLMPADGCPQCRRVGCVDEEQKYEAGYTFQMPPCNVCHCPNSGGELICYPLPECDVSKINIPPPTDNEESDSERHYDDPYSYDQEVPEKDLTQLESPKKHRSYITNSEQEENSGKVQNKDADRSLSQVSSTTSTVKLTEMTTVSYSTTSQSQSKIHTSQNEKVNKSKSRTTQAPHTQNARSPTVLQNSVLEEKKDGTTTKQSKNVVELPKNPEDLQAEGRRSFGGEESTTSTETLKEKEESTSKKVARMTQLFNEKNTSEENTVGREIKFNPTTAPPIALKEDQNNVSDRQSQTLYSYDMEEKEDPNSIHTTSRMQDVSTKDAIESFCAAGQQWAIDNADCTNIPVNEADCGVCRIVQKQCCISYVKENTCFAGMFAAKEGEFCVTDEIDDACGRSYYKECCDCCSLGLKLRLEGQICEPNPNLGYPCNNVMLSCCEGEGHLIPPEVLREPEPQTTLKPEKVSETEQHNEAFSVDNEEENILLGDDMDECLDYPGQLCKHLCINTVGSYKCGCFPGYVLQEDKISCKPENENKQIAALEEVSLSSEIQENTSVPPPEATTRASQIKEDKCIGNGPCMQVCNSIGKDIVCSCFPGFTLSSNVSCEDINECVADLHNCQRGEICVNTVGSFNCLKEITCQPGHERKDDTCVDIDECQRGTHNCKVNFVCQNTKGSFYCESKGRCMDGFLQDPEGNCVDINECTSLSEPCKPEFNCLNTVGSYTCQRKPVTCSRGYHSSEDGYRCVDIDECSTGVHRCGEGQICHNTPGAYRCDCKTGYQYDMFSRTCIDTNECWNYPGRLCQQTCENTPGSYHCSCSSGFRLSYDGKHCEDVNECENNPCSQECTNVYGSYQCYCRMGYQLAEDSHSCTDIDECTQAFGILCTFQCVNVPGSYQCACPDQGYTMSPNGRSCRDIDECATGTHNCSASEFCYNIQGGFRCLSVECPENYRKVSEMRCERISCLNYLDCQNTPVRITYYQLNFPMNIVVPSHIFRIGPSPAYAGDNIVLSITKGNEEGYFSTRKLNSYTGIVYLQRQIREPKDFLLDVEMKLLRQGTMTTFLAKIYVFITTQA